MERVRDRAEAGKLGRDGVLRGRVAALAVLTAAMLATARSLGRTREARPIMPEALDTITPSKPNSPRNRSISSARLMVAGGASSGCPAKP